MDPLTHALASYSLQRAAFPRLSRGATIAIVLAGVVADVDLLSIYFGPSAYLAFTHTYFHSILAALAFTLVATLRLVEHTSELQSPDHIVCRLLIYIHNLS